MASGNGKIRVAVATLGGHISALHAGMKAMHEQLQRRVRDNYELLGAKCGMKGLVEGRFVPILEEHLDERRAGSMIGSDRGPADPERIRQVMAQSNINAIIFMGGDDHLRQAQRCYEAGINIVGWPKTMDGDITSDASIGWHTAVSVGAKAARLHHNSAITNGIVFFVGLFGRDTDWVVSGVSAWGGADIAIPGEKAYTQDEIIRRVRFALDVNEARYGIRFAVIPFSEGAKIEGINNHLSGIVDAHGHEKLDAAMIGAALVRMMAKAGIRAQYEAHTYIMRDSAPTGHDIILARIAGEHCIDLILSGNFGKVPALNLGNWHDGGFGSVSLSEVGKQRRVTGTGFFDYERMVVDPSFVEKYYGFFGNELGKPPSKDELVYRNMTKRDLSEDHGYPVGRRTADRFG